MAVNQQLHPLVQSESFYSIEEYVLHLIHSKAYEHAANMAHGLTVLDWGCNQGYGMEILSKQAKLVCGLDVAPCAVEMAKQRLPELARYIRLYDFLTVPFDAEMFDIVTSFQVIEHVSEEGLKRYLSQVAGVLRKGGFAVFTTPNAAIRLDPGMRPWNEYHVCEFTPRQLRDLLARYFQRVEIKSMQGTPEIERVERQRCERARTGARRSGVLGSFKQKAAGACRSIGLIPERKRTPLSAELLSKFSLNGLYYTNANPDAGLDLMAIAWK